ncbi:MAG: DUF4468 domain-containing protein [Bacteroidia bacterium]
MTKNILALAISLLFGTQLINAQQVQQAPKLPVDEKSGLITYTKVTEITGTTAGVLYQRALEWANKYYKNPADVIRERDSIGGQIVCKARFKIMNPADKKGVATDAGNVMYTLKIQFKDGRYRYELTEINWKQQSYYPCERWMDKTVQSYKPEFDYYLQQTDASIRETLKAMEKALSAAPAAKKEDW